MVTGARGWSEPGNDPCGAGLRFVGGAVQDSLHESEQQHTQFWKPAEAKHQGTVEARDPCPVRALVRQAEDPCSSNVRPEAFLQGTWVGQSSTSPDRPGGPTSHLSLRLSAQNTIQPSSVAETPRRSTKLTPSLPGPRMVVCWLRPPGALSSRSTMQATEVVSNSPTAV